MLYNWVIPRIAQSKAAVGDLPVLGRQRAFDYAPKTSRCQYVFGALNQCSLRSLRNCWSCAIGILYRCMTAIRSHRSLSARRLERTCRNPLSTLLTQGMRWAHEKNESSSNCEMYLTGDVSILIMQFDVPCPPSSAV